MSLREHGCARCFGSQFPAPDGCIGSEETLCLCHTTFRCAIQCFPLGLQSRLKSFECEMDSAVVGRVLPERQLPILLDTGLGHVLRVLIGDAVVALLVGGSIGWSPPVTQVALRVELASLIIV